MYLKPMGVPREGRPWGTGGTGGGALGRKGDRMPDEGNWLLGTGGGEWEWEKGVRTPDADPAVDQELTVAGMLLRPLNTDGPASAFW